MASASGGQGRVNRYYDPATEQFLSVDPAVDQTGTPYAFTAGDPVNGSDPSGLLEVEDEGGANEYDGPLPGEETGGAGGGGGGSEDTWTPVRGGEAWVNNRTGDISFVNPAVEAEENAYPCEAEVNTADREVGLKIGGPNDFDPQMLRGLTPDEVKARIPSDWEVASSKSGGGELFRDPDNLGRQIRLMPGYGYGSRPDPITWGPYAVVSQNSSVLKVPLAGNPTL